EVGRERRVQAFGPEGRGGDLGVHLMAREMDDDLAHEPVMAVSGTRMGARMTARARIARSGRGWVRTRTAAPIGDATSAATKTIAASGGPICAVAALPMSGAIAAKRPMPSED